MAEQPDAKSKPNWGALVPTMVALFTALFTAMGFLATRSYLSGLGVPEHVNIQVNGYIQYGGRFFFVLAVHVLPISVCAGLLFIIGMWVTKWWAWLGKMSETGLFICMVLGAAAFTTVSLELLTLPPEPVFSPGRVRDVAGEMQKLCLIELGVAITVAWLVRQFTYLWSTYHNTLFQKALLTIALLSVLVEVLLFPVCFGRMAMIPKSFDRVTLRRENEPANLKGILVFSDADSYFLFTEDRKLVEVSHHTVKEVQYEYRELLENLVTR